MPSGRCSGKGSISRYAAAAIRGGAGPLMAAAAQHAEHGPQCELPLPLSAGATCSP